MILVQNRISHFIPGRKFRILCVWPFLFVSNAEPRPLPPEVLNHERIHARQQLEMLWVFFFIWYGAEFMIRWFQQGDRFRAYRSLSHEQEAFRYERDAQYLKVRKLFAWISFM